MAKTITVVAQGKDEADAYNNALGGWFTEFPQPIHAKEAQDSDGRLYSFKITAECLGVFNPDRFPCPKCEGCGQVADTENQEPWSIWLSLPVKSALAVTTGIVKPIPCPMCRGTKLAAALDTIERAGQVLKGGDT